MSFHFRFVAKILEIDKDDKEVKVHFTGWGSRFDEWILVSEGDRLRTVGINSVERYHKKKRERNVMPYEFLCTSVCFVVTVCQFY